MKTILILSSLLAIFGTIDVITTVAKVQDGVNWTGYYCNHFGRKLGRDIEWITRPKPNERHLWPKMATRCTSLMFSAPLSIVGLPFHILFNGLASYVPAHRLRVIQGESLPASNTVTVMSLNACFHEGLFAPITGGVVPPFDPAADSKSRVAAVAKWVGEQGPDVYVGQEFHDLRVVKVFIEEMQKYGYTAFITDPSPHSICVNSGLIVASKRKIGDVSFIAYPLKDRAGLTKGVRQGAITFSLLDAQDKPVVRIFNTHLNSGGPETQWARSTQMRDYIMPHFIGSTPAILMGDLNFDTSEFRTESGLGNYVNQVEGQVTCSNEGKLSLRGRKIAYETEMIDGIIGNGEAVEFSNVKITQLKIGGDLLSDHYAVSATAQIL